MRLITNFSRTGYANSYVLGSEQGGPAILIDPGFFDARLLHQIEDNNLDLQAVLLTHSHRTHTGGLRAVLRIYAPTVYAWSDVVQDASCQPARHGQTFCVGAMLVRVIGTPGHSPDSLCFDVGGHLFTGDSLSAGSIGITRNQSNQETLIGHITTRLLTYPAFTLVLPGHGPPTSIDVERRLNPHLTSQIGAGGAEIDPAVWR